MPPPPRTSILEVLDQDEVSDPYLRRLALYTIVAPDTVQRFSQQALAATLTQHRANPFHPLPGSNQINTGKIDIGTTSTGQPYAIEETQLSKHFLAIGQSGAGKTTLFYNLLSQLEVPFWSFDLKQDYRHLVTNLDELLVVPWTELKLNPLVPPPGVTPRRWAQVVSEIFGHATALLSGSKNHLLKSILELYRLYSLFEEKSPPYPSFHELEQFLVFDPINYMRKTSNYRDTVLNRVEAMNLGAGTIFDCSEGYSFEELLTQNVVFELDGLSRDTQNFLMELLLAWVYEYRLAQTHRSSTLNHVFALDEAKQVFSVYKERQDAAGIPAVDELTAKMREFGEGLIVADQEASKLTDSIKANTYTTALLATGDRKQFTAVADSMNLTDWQLTAAQDLRIGEAVLQTGNDNPVRVTLHEFDVEKDVTDTELARTQDSLWNELSSTPRQRPSGFEDIIDVKNENPNKVISDPDQSLSLSSEAQQLLRDVVEYPFVALTQRYDQFSSHHVGHDAKTELVDTGVVAEKLLQAGSRRRKLLELTERGHSFVEDNLDCTPSHRGRGGIIHRYWQHQVKKTLKDKGWTAKRELFDADVYANTGQTEVVVEIAMENTSREREHVEAHLETGFDAVWVVCPTEDVLEGLENRIADAGLDTEQVVFRETSDFEET